MHNEAVARVLDAQNTLNRFLFMVNAADGTAYLDEHLTELLREANGDLKCAARALRPLEKKSA